MGNVIQIGIFIAAMAGAWAIMDSRGQTNGEKIERNERNVASNETRIRALETQSTRADERLANIFALLSRIDNRLERIEQSR